MVRALFAILLLSTSSAAAQSTLVAEGDHTCALRGGEVICWGEWEHTDWNGVECGSPSPDRTRRVSHRSPTRVATIASARALGVGWFHGCALDASGRVSCWGHHMPITAPRTAGPPVRAPFELFRVGPIPIEDVASLAASGESACGVRRDGTVYCWGNNDYGQSGPGDLPVRIIPGLSHPASIAVGGSRSCAVVSDGSVRCWGSADPAISSLRDVSQISLGGFSSCALRRDGRVLCWSTQPSLAPAVIAGVASVRALVSSGERHCALSTDGRVTCWALDEARGVFTSPAPIPSLTGVTQLALGNAHACAERRGTIVCWGENDRGQLGDGTLQDRARPVAIALPR